MHLPHNKTAKAFHNSSMHENMMPLSLIGSKLMAKLTAAAQIAYPNKFTTFPTKLIKYLHNLIEIYMYMTAYLLFSTFRSDEYCEWIVNKYVIFFDNDCMILGNESPRNKINKIKQCYIVVLILHSCLLSMWYILFITKWDIRKREDFFKFYTVTSSNNGTQFSWFCKFLEMFNIWFRSVPYLTLLKLETDDEIWSTISL